MGSYNDAQYVFNLIRTLLSTCHLPSLIFIVAWNSSFTMGKSITGTNTCKLKSRQKDLIACPLWIKTRHPYNLSNFPPSCFPKTRDAFLRANTEARPCCGWEHMSGFLLPKPWCHLCNPALCNQKHTGPPSIWAAEWVNIGAYGRGLSVYRYSKYNTFHKCPEGLWRARHYQTVSEQQAKKTVGPPFLWVRCSQPSPHYQATMICTISSMTKGLMKAEPRLFFITVSPVPGAMPITVEALKKHLLNERTLCLARHGNAITEWQFNK